MSKNKKEIQTYCRIMDYLDVKDPMMAELLRATCADMSLSVRGKTGVTFLRPIDDNYRKKLADKAYSASVEDANQACDMLNACIIKGVFKTPSSWGAPDIPNSMFPSQKVSGAKADGNSVLFDPYEGSKPVVAKLNTEFEKSSRKPNIVIWDVEGGGLKVPVNSPSAVNPRKKKGVKGGSINGGYDVSNDEMANKRFQIGIFVENKNELDRMSDPNREFLTVVTLSLISHIKKNNSDVYYNRVLPLISCTPFDFYLLVEPHGNSGGEYLVDDNIIDAWWKSGNWSVCDCSSVTREIENSYEEAKRTGASVYTNRSNLMDAVNKVKDRIKVSKLNLYNDVKSIYATLCNDNRIGDIDNVLPESLHEYYQGRPLLKLLQDELRHAFCMQLHVVRKSGGDVGELYSIPAALHAKSESERESSLSLMNDSKIKYSIGSNELELARGFVDSTSFLYMSCPYSSAKELGGNIVGSKGKFWNLDLLSKMHHNRIVALLKNAEVSDNLKSLISKKSSDFSEEDKSKLKELYDKIVQKA